MELSNIDAATASPAFASFTVETKALADAVAFLAKRVTERRNTIPLLSCIAICADLPGRVTMTASDLDNFATVELPADVATPGEFAVDAGALSDILAKARKDADTATFQDGDRVTVAAGRGRYNLTRLPLDGFPALPFGDGEAVAFTVPAGRFLADLGALAPCISKEETRYYLRGVALQVCDLGGRDRFAMIATDGHKMGIASRDLPEGAAMLPNVLLPAKAAGILRHAAKLAPTCDVLGVEFHPDRGAGKFRFTLGGVSIECKAIDGTFPDWQRPWGEQLAPTDGEAPLFPELLPAAPLGHMQAIEKACKDAIAWEPARDGMIGTLAEDSGILFAAINPVGANLEPVKGYRVTFEADQDAAGRYLLALADQRAARAVSRDKCRLQVRGGEVLGLTVGDWTHEQGRYEDQPNWETLHVEKVWIEGRNVYEDGAYSEVMPRDRAKMRPDVTLEIDGDATVYPLGVKGAAVHLSKDQVRAIVGESCFETMAIEIAGRTVYILQWLWDQGDTRFLTVRKDGRTFKGGEIVTRAEIEAAMRGEIAEPAPMLEIAATEPAQSESAPVAAQESPEAVEAIHGPDMPTDEPVTVADELPAVPAHDLDAITARLDALEQALSTLSAASDATPIAEPARAKRTPAHERAIRRAWAERKARRDSEAREAEMIQTMTVAAANQAASNGEIMRLRDALAIEQQQAGETYRHATMMTARGNQQRERRLATTRRARRMIAAARAQERIATAKASAARAEIDRLKRDIADPTTPDRASDVARLVRERDEARTALAAVTERAKRAEQGLESMADRFTSLVSRVTKAEAALREKAA